MNWFEYFKRNLIKWHRFRFDRKKIENSYFFYHFRWWLEVAAKIFNLSRFVYKSSLSSLKVSSVCLYPIRKYWERNIWICGHRISQQEVDFTKKKYSLETFVMFTICVKLKSKTLFIGEIYGFENEIMKVFFFKITGSWRLNFRWGKLYMIFQRELNKVV